MWIEVWINHQLLGILQSQKNPAISDFFKDIFGHFLSHSAISSVIQPFQYDKYIPNITNISWYSAIPRVHLGDVNIPAVHLGESQRSRPPGAARVREAAAGPRRSRSPGSAVTAAQPVSAAERRRICGVAFRCLGYDYIPAVHIQNGSSERYGDNG